MLRVSPVKRPAPQSIALFLKFSSCDVIKIGVRFMLYMLFWLAKSSTTDNHLAKPLPMFSEIATR
jgi:hypothetical protein